jgi:hypothetical protein
VRHVGGAVRRRRRRGRAGSPRGVPGAARGADGSFIHFDIEDRLRREPGVEEVRVVETWTPAWTKSRITPEGREALRRFGVSM